MCDFRPELIVSRINLPVFRAGFGNIYTAFIIIWTYIYYSSGGFFRNEMAGLILYSLILILFSLNYLTCISRIDFSSKTMTITTTAGMRNILVNDIKKFKISHSRLSSYIKLTFWLKNRNIPLSFNFIVVTKTSFGDYKGTLRELEKRFLLYGLTSQQ